MARLSKDQVDSLCAFVDERVQQRRCDHSLRFSREWAARESVDWDDLLDLLQANGGCCDCEVVLNLPEDMDLVVEDVPPAMAAENAWRLPPSFTCNPDHTFTKIIACNAQLGRNTHAADGETLVPAPKGAKPRKRVRKVVHFFVGCTSGLPSEVGVVADCTAVTAEAFARRVAESAIPELRQFTFREAAFVLSKVQSLAPGTPVGTSFLMINDVTENHEELRVHRVALWR